MGGFGKPSDAKDSKVMTAPRPVLSDRTPLLDTYMCACTYVAACAAECTRMIDQAPKKITGIPRKTLLNFIRVYNYIYA